MLINTKFRYKIITTVLHQLRVDCSVEVVLEWKYLTQLHLPRSKQKDLLVRSINEILSQGEDIYGDAGNHTQGPECIRYVFFLPLSCTPNFSFWSFKIFIFEDHTPFHFNSHAWHRILFFEFFLRALKCVVWQKILLVSFEKYFIHPTLILSTSNLKGSLSPRMSNAYMHEIDEADMKRT